MANKKERHLHLILLLLYLLCNGPLYAQEPIFKQFTIEDGLPSNETYMTMEDRKGYMWISTDHGVARYDGYDFETFTTQDGLEDNSVLLTYEDPNGRIWVVTYSRSIAYFENNQFHSLDIPEEWRSRGKGVPISMHLTPEDTLWVGSKIKSWGTFMKIAPDGSIHEENTPKARAEYPTGKGITPILPPWERAGVINYIKVFPDSGFVYSAWKGTADLIIQEGENLAEMREQPLLNRVPHRELAVHQCKNGDVLVAYLHKLLRYRNGELELLCEFDYDNNLGLFQDSDGNVWISLSDGGVLVYEKGDFSKPPEHWLKESIVSHISEDRHGSIWVTTLDNGVFYTASTKTKSYLTKKLFPNKNIIKTLRYKNYLLAATIQGWVYRIDLTPGMESKMDSLKIGNGRAAFFSNESDSLCLFQGDLGPGGGRLYVLSIPSFKVMISHDWMVNCVVEFNDSILFGGLRGGLLKKNWRTNETKYILHSQNHRWFSACKDDTCSWLGDWFGLWKFKDEKLEDQYRLHPLLKGRINGMVKYGDYLLMATANHGLVIRGKDGIWNISKKEGLLDINCHTVQVDVDGDIWVTSNAGLSRILDLRDQEHYKIINYSGASYLVSNEVTNVQMIDSILWVITPLGFNTIDKNNLDKKPEIPKVYIKSFKINDRDTTVDKPLDLPHSSNNISIAFTGISFPSAGELRYKYRMLGLDTGWSAVEGRRLNFPQMNPGSYRFELMAASAQGNWSLQPAVLQFVIRSPFWETWWFNSLLVLVVLSIGYFIIRYRIGKIKSENNLKLAYLESELKALRVQITPHFIFNAINSILGLIAQNKNENATTGLARFARLMRHVLDTSEQTLISLGDEISSLELYLDLERLRFDHNFQYTIEVDPQLDPDFTDLPPMVIQPYVENAIKHGLNHKMVGSKKVNLKFDLSDDILIVTITDNGIGRAASEKMQLEEKVIKSGHGMKISGERIRILNETMNAKMKVEVEDLVDKNGVASGTCVRLYFPQKN